MGRVVEGPYPTRPAPNKPPRGTPGLLGSQACWEGLAQLVPTMRAVPGQAGIETSPWPKALLHKLSWVSSSQEHPGWAWHIMVPALTGRSHGRLVPHCYCPSPAGYILLTSILLVSPHSLQKSQPPCPQWHQRAEATGRGAQPCL